MGEHLPLARNLSSLRLLGTVGEPINRKLGWYHVIGGDRCPIVDTWWQTETGGNDYTATWCHTHETRFCNSTPGILADVVDLEGKPVADNDGGYLAIRHPWPGMMRTSTAIQIASAAPTEHIPPKMDSMSTLPVMVPGAIKMVTSG